MSDFEDLSAFSHTDRRSQFARRINAPENVRIPGSHLGLSWRKLEPKDVPQAVRLYVRCAGEQLTGEQLSTNEFAGRLEVALRDTKRSDTLCGWNANHDLIALAMVALNESALTELQIDIFAVVETSWRSRGIGRALLEWQDGRARQLAVADGRDLPVAIRSSVNSANLDRRRLLAAGGFSPQYKKVLMVRKIGSDDARLGPQARKWLADKGYRRERFSLKYCEELRNLHNRLTITKERSQPISAQNWKNFLPRIDMNHSYLLFDGNDVVAYTLTVDTAVPGLIFVRHYGVERRLRGRGIGLNMILSLLDSEMPGQKDEIRVPVVLEGNSTYTFLSRHGFLEGLSQILYSIDL